MSKPKPDNEWTRACATRRMKSKYGKCLRQKQLELEERLNALESEENVLISRPIELPDYTQWFDVDSINCIEKECATNIFIGYGDDKNSSLEMYKRIRNTIVNLYRENPGVYLSVTDCVRKTGYDASIVMKVHSLLNYWGIINFQVTNEQGERVFNKKLQDEVDDLGGSLSNQFSLYKRPNYNSILSKRKNYYDKMRETTTLPFELFSAEEVVRYTAELNSGCNVITTTRYPTCSGCRSACNTSYYILGPDTLGEVTNSVRNRGIWCTLCYCNSNYPLTFSKDNFVRIDVPPRLSDTLSKLPDNRLPKCKLSDNRFFRNNMFGSKKFDEDEDEYIVILPNSTRVNIKHNVLTIDDTTVEHMNKSSKIDGPYTRSKSGSNKSLDKHSKDKGEPWTPADFEKLYEAIRKYGTDWQSVAQHIGDETTPNECIFQFINAPLEKEITSKLKLTTYMEPPTEEGIGPNFPFFDSPNTIVTLLSFCASVVSPVVASSAAKAAFDIILNSCQDNNQTSCDTVQDTQLQNTTTSSNNNNNTTTTTNNTSINSNVNSDTSNQNQNQYQRRSLGGLTDNSSNFTNQESGTSLLNGGSYQTNGQLQNDNQENHFNHSGSNYVNSLGSSSSSFENRNNTLNGSTHSRPDEQCVNNNNVNQLLNNSNSGDKSSADKPEPVNKLVEGNTLQKAAAAALRAAALRAGELALKEDDRLTQVLPNLISLKISRITEKLNRYNETQDRMRQSQIELVS